MEKRNDPAGSPRGIVSLGRGPNHGTQRVQIPGKYPASTRQQATGTVETENDNAKWAGGQRVRIMDSWIIGGGIGFASKGSV